MEQVEKISEKIVKIKDWFDDYPLNKPVVIGGPCSAETETQVLETCRQLAATQKVHILRAGIWKPRTRPGTFEGIGSEGLKWLNKAKKETGLKVTVEVANVKHVYEALKNGVDILWIGARTTVNPFSVQEIADALKGIDIPVMVKNPINADLELWIGAIERLHHAGIHRLAAIHRGFAKHGEKKYRNAPQWQIPIELQRRIPDISLLCDPSHICGNREGIQSVAQEALDLNFDGVMIESHIDPDTAWSDAKQQVVPSEFEKIIQNLVVRSEKPTQNENVLENYRLQIDNYDDEILALFAKRMKIAESIGKYKKENNVQIYQSNRWDDIIKNAIAKGVKSGLSPEFIEKYLRAVHQESINHQNAVMNET